jgi:hypothetical protein
MRIWRYLDLAKLVSMFSSKALYFASPSELNDPYEGYMPRSHVKAHEEIAANILAQLRSSRDEVVARFPDRDRSIADAAVAKGESELNAPAMLKDVATRFGVNCWHKNEHESAATSNLAVSTNCCGTSKSATFGQKAGNSLPERRAAESRSVAARCTTF